MPTLVMDYEAFQSLSRDDKKDYVERMTKIGGVVILEKGLNSAAKARSDDAVKQLNKEINPRIQSDRDTATQTTLNLPINTRTDDVSTQIGERQKYIATPEQESLMAQITANLQKLNNRNQTYPQNKTIYQPLDTPAQQAQFLATFADNLLKNQDQAKWGDWIFKRETGINDSRTAIETQIKIIDNSTYKPIAISNSNGITTIQPLTTGDAISLDIARQQMVNNARQQATIDNAPRQDNGFALGG